MTPRVHLPAIVQKLVDGWGTIRFPDMDDDANAGVLSLDYLIGSSPPEKGAEARELFTLKRSFYGFQSNTPNYPGTRLYVPIMIKVLQNKCRTGYLLNPFVRSGSPHPKAMQFRGTPTLSPGFMGIKSIPGSLNVALIPNLSGQSIKADSQRAYPLAQERRWLSSAA